MYTNHTINTHRLTVASVITIDTVVPASMQLKVWKFELQYVGSQKVI